MTRWSRDLYLFNASLATPFLVLFLSLVLAGCQGAGDRAASFCDNKVKVFVLTGQSNMTGRGVLSYGTRFPEKEPTTTLLGLTQSREHARKYGFLRQGDLKTEDGWHLRDDVFVTTGPWPHPAKGEEGYNTSRKHGMLGPYFGGRGNRGFGPEWPIGIELGEAYKAPVLLVKVSFGGNSLVRDFRPPGSGGRTGPRYPMILKAVAEAIEHLPEIIPGYTEDQGYELIGLFWNQGLSDLNYKSSAEYQHNLVNLITDLKRDLKCPELKSVVAVTGNWGWGIKRYREHLVEYAEAKKKPVDVFMKERGQQFLDSLQAIRKAQMAVSKLPEFLSSVATAETRDFWRPRKTYGGHGTWQHWNANAESYWLIGESMGKAMVRLLQR
jgi:hypothetical protein